MHRPAAGRGAGCGITAGVARGLVLNDVAVEDRPGREARARCTSLVARAVAVDHVTGKIRRGVAARDRTSAARGPCLGVDGICPIYAGVFGKIKLNEGCVRRNGDRHRVGATFDVLGVIDHALGAGGRGQLGSNRGEGVALGIGDGRWRGARAEIESNQNEVAREGVRSEGKGQRVGASGSRTGCFLHKRGG